MAKINARQKGHTFEREVAKRWRELGWERCVTSRSESKNLDDKGIDLCYTDPFIIQCKAVESLNIHKAYSAMPDMEGMYKVLFSKKNRQGTLVTMSMDDFLELVDKLRVAGVIGVV